MCKIECQTQKSSVRIIELDQSQVEVIEEINQVTIRLSSNPKLCQMINVLVADIPDLWSDPVRKITIYDIEMKDI